MNALCTWKSMNDLKEIRIESVRKWNHHHLIDFISLNWTELELICSPFTKNYLRLAVMGAFLSEDIMKWNCRIRRNKMKERIWHTLWHIFQTIKGFISCFTELILITWHKTQGCNWNSDFNVVGTMHKCFWTLVQLH